MRRERPARFAAFLSVIMALAPFPSAAASGGAEKEFQSALDFYNRRVRDGASREERLFILEKLEKRWAGRPEDLEVVLAEKRRVAGDGPAEAARSWAFYRHRVQEGAGIPERLFILSKIESKNPDAGAALEKVRAERRALEDLVRVEELSRRFEAEWGSYARRPPLWGDEEERLARLNQWEAEYGDVPGAAEKLRAARASIAAELFGAPPRAKKSVKGFMRLDAWVREEAYKADHEQARASVPGFLSIGYDSASASAKETGGMGLRGGLLWLSRERPVAMGGSVGYVLGPEQELTLNAVDAAAEDGRRHTLMETDFLRVMFEAQARATLARRVELRVGGGAGLAKGRIRRNVGNSGSFVSALQYEASRSNARSWDGLAWEVSPALAFLGEETELELGLTYAYFPALAADGGFNAFEWSPLGVHLKFEF
jgi:hypothetical protein